MQLSLSTRSLVAVAIAGSLAAIGCGSKPIPMVAVAGTTITIAVPDGFPTGYGRMIAANPTHSDTSTSFTGPAYSATSALEDPQRGELVFDLYTTAGAFVRHLQLATITRVSASQQSRAATGYNPLYGRGQSLALVNIPYDVAANSYSIRARIYRRVPGTSTSFELVPVSTSYVPGNPPYQGWGDDSIAAQTANANAAAGIPITIRAGDGANHFTPLSGWGDGGAPYGVVWRDVSSDLAQLSPYPAFELSVKPNNVSLPAPAAWEAQILYPRNQIRIRGVELLRPAASQAMVSWQAENPNATVNCGGLPGFLNIQVIDPERASTGIRVAYDLRNFDQSCGGRASTTSFNVWPGTFHAYDLDGGDVTGTTTYSIPSTSFF